MAFIGVPAITANGIATDTSRPFPNRDQLLDGVANSGVRFLFDLAFPYSYPGGAPTGRAAAGAPANNAVVQDMTDTANGSVSVPGGSIPYSGGGFDMGSVVITGTAPGGVVAPAAVMADLFAAFGGKSQRALVCGYFKLPTLANWNAGATLLTMLGSKPYTSAAAFITLHQISGGNIGVRRQTGAATAENSNWTITPNAGDYGSVVQLAYWRNDAGQGLRLRSANGTILNTLTVGTDNTQDFSTNQLAWGRAAAFEGAGTTAGIAGTVGLRVFRGFVENLARSGRDPATVLDADYTRTVARGVFS